MTRNTKSGAVLEAMVLPSMRMGGYDYQLQVKVGQRPGGGLHKVDAVAWHSQEIGRVLVSAKWQQTSGTAEQKVAYEVISLIETLQQHDEYCGAFLVLGGGGFKLRDYFTGRDFEGHLPHRAVGVRVLSLEAFVAAANKTRLHALLVSS